MRSRDPRRRVRVRELCRPHHRHRRRHPRRRWALQLGQRQAPRPPQPPLDRHAFGRRLLGRRRSPRERAVFALGKGGLRHVLRRYRRPRVERAGFSCLRGSYWVRRGNSPSPRSTGSSAGRRRGSCSFERSVLTSYSSTASSSPSSPSPASTRRRTWPRRRPTPDERHLAASSSRSARRHASASSTSSRSSSRCPTTRRPSTRASPSSTSSPTRSAGRAGRSRSASSFSA